MLYWIDYLIVFVDMSANAEQEYSFHHKINTISTYLQ